MSVRGTYFTALANGEAIPAGRDRVFAIVRDVPEWAEDLIDRAVPHLAPPESLEKARRRVEEAAEKDDDVDDALAVSWRSTDYETRFQTYLRSSGARQVLSKVQSDAEERAVWLVSWRADDLYDHRRIVLAELRQRTQDGPCDEGQHRWRRGTVVGVSVCDICDYSSQSIIDWFGQDVRIAYGGDRR
ncbi:hypothetical protein E6P09_07680 [Haloferax mediterranei ATCC 33500]|uniref:Uncharacterized protein n=2 Tax=Haloferax mediterranei (strain ATCC 33500 / DSM 1411 / JCM 8866 / NBRC 14739 / NCIMB 2177 / R-4) TaxID=523841 RepID=I3R337_HALMT|nr:hypothetical protein [Haloferax mediterranei]AFK18647.1 hypothetical protein HFX_0927 [Haloferax mediterranei ATCC 33500]MDX5988741.1 hypothetical protein [Haloferax mediterranei ATCC 33500]QCQ75148.1 hypothetical protein E6P09_07680 [Haloferax mediterranei ATCC 33500]